MSERLRPKDEAHWFFDTNEVLIMDKHFTTNLGVLEQTFNEATSFQSGRRWPRCSGILILATSITEKRGIWTPWLASCMKRIVGRSPSSLNASKWQANS